ncbi:MAG: YfcE family phosphodiesterase [Eubacteriales bacterium]|nr:YfcE family phosphodiesterase [Eubacteriales bacterium]
MLLCVISDSHGNAQQVYNIIEYCKQTWGVTHFVHCGDGSSDLLNSIKSNLVDAKHCYAVKGNCDFNILQDELFVEIEKSRILISHGHKYNVKNSLLSLGLRAQELGANLVLFGHTHISLNIELDGIHYINPGSCKYEKQFELLEIDGNHIHAVHIS